MPRSWVSEAAHGIFVVAERKVSRIHVLSLCIIGSLGMFQCYRSSRDISTAELSVLVGSPVSLDPVHFPKSPVNHISPTSRVPLTISVCIPAIPRDVESGCLHELFSSIRNQSLLPTDVILSLTNTSLEDAKSIHESLQRIIGDVPLRVVRSTELYVQGKSRNSAVLASSAELISFIDADDLMHPQRMRILEEAFNRNSHLELFLHGYTQELDTGKWANEAIIEAFSGNKWRVFNKTHLCESERRTRHQPHLDLNVHHAHLTVRRSTFLEFSFDETKEGFRIEDSLFVRQVIAATCSKESVAAMQFLEAPLTFYRGKNAKCKHSNS